MHLNIPLIFFSGRDKQISSNLPFVAISITFLLGRYRQKKCAEVKVAELRAFDGKQYK